jgi:hypothetical protein
MPIPDNERVVGEKTNAKFTGTFKDESGTVVPLSALSALKLTQYLDDGTIINSRDSQDAKNANNVTFHATSGLLTWILQQADTAIIGNDPNTELEKHNFEFEFTYISGSDTLVFREKDYYFVRNHLKVT